MKLLVERHRRVSHTVLTGLSLLRVDLMPTTVVASATIALSSTAVANQHIELSDLVSVLAWSWDLDRASPVEVAVAQGKGQLLNFSLFERALVYGHEAMSS